VREGGSEGMRDGDFPHLTFQLNACPAATWGAISRVRQWIRGSPVALYDSASRACCSVRLTHSSTLVSPGSSSAHGLACRQHGSDQHRRSTLNTDHDNSHNPLVRVPSNILIRWVHRRAVAHASRVNATIQRSNRARTGLTFQRSCRWTTWTSRAAARCQSRHVPQVGR
jgi:hypothetical protein